MLRPKHPLDRLLALNASGVHDLMGSFTTHPAEEKCLVTLDARRAGPVTSFLFLRYRLQSFKLAAKILDRDAMMVVIS
jgi:hypothetical protein